MKSRWLINLLLFTTLLILALIARFEPGIKKPKQQAVTSLSASDVTRLHITRPLRDALVLERDSDGFWWIDRKPRLPAEPHQVNALTRLAEQRVVRSYPADTLDLAQLELQPPRASLTLNDTRIDFGGLEALENLRYLRVGDRVDLVPDLYLYLVEAGYTQFVRRQILPQQARITALSLPGLTLRRNKTGGWDTTPERDLSSDTLQSFIETWQTATAINVRETEASPKGDPVTLHLAGQQQPIELVVTSRQPELVLARPAFGIEYRMGDMAARLLEPGPPADAP